MFIGPAKEQTDVIKVPDADQGSFTEMLRFVYYEQVNLTGDNVMATLYLAKKYLLSQLADRCNEFLKRNLDAGNVCSILPPALHLDEQDLAKRCFKIIDTKTAEVLKSEAFLTLSAETLIAILERDTLVGVEEIDLFKGCIRWAEAECMRKDLERSSANMRIALGDALYKIRFPVMSIDVFSNQVTTTDILNKDESLSVFLHLTRNSDNATTENSSLFPLKMRSKVPHKKGNSPQHGYRCVCSAQQYCSKSPFQICVKCYSVSRLACPSGRTLTNYTCAPLVVTWRGGVQWTTCFFMLLCLVLLIYNWEAK